MVAVSASDMATTKSEPGVTRPTPSCPRLQTPSVPYGSGSCRGDLPEGTGKTHPGVVTSSRCRGTRCGTLRPWKRWVAFACMCMCMYVFVCFVFFLFLLVLRCVLSARQRLRFSFVLLSFPPCVFRCSNVRSERAPQRYACEVWREDCNARCVRCSLAIIRQRPGPEV